MMTGRKRWWRAVALAAVGGGVIGGWFGLVRPQLAKADKGQGEETNWTRSTASTPAPSVAEVRSPEAAPPTGPVLPASGTLPIPNSKDGGPVAPVVPVTPPVLVPSVPLPVPHSGLPEIQPVAGPRVPDAGLVSGDARPTIPAVPSLPPAELPPFPTTPKMPEGKPVTPPAYVTPEPPAPPVGIPSMPPSPAPAPLPMTTAEPPKAAPLPPPMPFVSPGGMASSPVAPVMPIVPPGTVLTPPVGLSPPPSPVKSVPPVQPAHPAKPDSDLKPSDPPTTLKPTAPLVAPATPIAPPATGHEAPGTPVDRPKPVDPNFGTADKFVFPVPLKPVTPGPAAPTPRDDTMSALSTTAAFAVLGGAIFAIEKANAFPVVPTPGALVKADDKTDVENLKKDLKDANKKIEDLEKQVKRLTDLLTGKREGGILVDPTAPGTIDDVKALKDRIADLEKELRALKTQTSLRPSVGTPPEVKPRGIVKVVNEYPVEISMVINEKSYRVAPNTKIEVEVPAGDFSYQLLQSGAAVTKSVIKDKETVTLRIK